VNTAWSNQSIRGRNISAQAQRVGVTCKGRKPRKKGAYWTGTRSGSAWRRYKMVI